MKRVAKYFDAIWLPVLLLLATSWLYAPWLNHDRIGSLRLISDYEASGAAWSWFFRVGDIAGAVVMVLVVLRGKVFAQNRLTASCLLIIAALSAIDGFFLNNCVSQCGAWDNVSHYIHVTETILSIVTIGLLSLYDGLVRRHRSSQLFLLAELSLAAVAAFGGSFDHQYKVVAQYIYQPLTIVWIVYLLKRYLPAPARRHSTAFRRFIAGLVTLLGSLELLQALHVRAYGPITEALLERSRSLIATEHSVITGLVLLYLARHLFRGERRAALISITVLVTAGVKYALFTPAPIQLLIISALLVGLWLGWPAFDRNTAVPPLLSRLQDFAVVGSGLVVSVAVLLLVAQFSGRSANLSHDANRFFTGDHSISGRQEQLERRVQHLSLVATSVAVTAGALLLWTVFRPAGRAAEDTLTAGQAIGLLDTYGDSSEDYFKIWPAGKQYFTQAGIDGFIAYRRAGASAFALAGPICPPAQRSELVAGFHAYCRRQGWTACWLLVDEADLPLYTASGAKPVRMGASAVVEIAGFVQTTLRDKWWRWQRNRAGKAGLHYDQSRPPHSQPLLAELRVVSDEWLARDGHREQGFALGYFNEAYMQRCTVHLLRDGGGRLVAFTNQLPSYNQIRQTTVDLIRYRPDVDGAMPMLLSEMIVNYNGGNYTSFDLGFVPLAKLDGPVASLARYLGSVRYSAAGLEQFKGKFKPDWRPQYLVYTGDLLDVPLLLANLQRVLDVKDI